MEFGCCTLCADQFRWLNLIERWFGELTSKRVRRDSFHSVQDLEKAIAEFLAPWNEHPQPFLWTATVEFITEKLSRYRQTLEQIQPGCTSELVSYQDSAPQDTHWSIVKV